MNAARKMVPAVVALALIVAPAAAMADGSPQSAEKQCRQERTAMGKTTFDQAYGTNANRSNAFGRCVAHRSQQNHADQTTAQSNAAARCRAERQNGPAAFKAKYGSNKNGHDAFGKCVSNSAKRNDQSLESGQVRTEESAARQCRAERQSDPAAFKARYGGNHNGRNAFGKCVSTRAKTQEQASGAGS